MRRRPFLILIIILLLGGLVWAFVSKRDDGTSAPAEGGGLFQNFFSRGNTPVPASDGSEDGTLPESDFPVLAETSRFNPITRSAVAGYVLFDRVKVVTIPSSDPKQKPTTQSVVEHYIRYVSRTSGYVYEIKDGGTPTQISNIYIPNIYEATFTPDGKVVIVRFLRDDERTIATYSIPIPEQNPDGTRTQVAGTYFSDGIASLALSPDGKTVAQIAENGNGITLSTSSVINTGKKEIVRSPFEGWLPQWQNQSIFLQTKASAHAPGFLYRIDAGTKRFIKVIGDIPGLTASISPKGTYVLYSESIPNDFTTHLLTTKTSSARRLNLPLLPEKCAWLRDENLLCAGGGAAGSPASYPDAWYAGTVSFSDNIYRIYSSVGGHDILDEGEEWSYDATFLKADEEQRLLYFIEKGTGILWSFEY